MSLNNYEIKPASELLKIQESVGSEFIFQDNRTKAHIYQLNNGQFVLFPAVGSKGLLVKDKETLDLILKTRVPIDDTKNPFVQKQELLIDLPGSAEGAIKELSRKLDVEIDLTNLSFNEDVINKAVRKYGVVKAYEDLSVELGILICERLRKADSKLIYKKKTRYGYNPYYEVELNNGVQSISPWYYLNRALLEKRRFNFSEIYEKTSRFGF